MTLEAFKLLFAERPEAPEGVEFWEWVEAPRSVRDAPDLDGDFAKVGLWSHGGARVVYVFLHWPQGVRKIYYHAEREGALNA
jgi:hypothetical protein